MKADAVNQARLTVQLRLQTKLVILASHQFSWLDCNYTFTRFRNPRFSSFPVLSLYPIPMPGEGLKGFSQHTTDNGFKDNFHRSMDPTEYGGLISNRPIVLHEIQYLSN